MISIVLATDMARHFKDQGKLKNRIASDDFNMRSHDKLFVMSFLAHMADISNPTKRWDICIKWVELLFQEFFN